MTMTWAGVVALATTLVCGLGGVSSGVTGAAEVGHVDVVPQVNRVVDTVLRSEPYQYRRKNWRVRQTNGLPGWLEVRKGRLAGTAPRLGTWRITLEERGIRSQRGERRRTALVLRAVTQRAARGTVLVSSGMDGGRANEGSRDVTISGDGSTVVFSSRATNLVPGTEESAGRLYVWDTATQTVTLLHPEHWAVLKGVSHDGRRVLVQLSAGLFLMDRADGSLTQVAERTVGAALTADGERVVYQDRVDQFGQAAPQLLEWTRVSGTVRILSQDLGSQTMAGMSPNGRFVLFFAHNASALLDVATSTFSDPGRLGIEGGYASWVDVSDDGRLLAVRGAGPGGSGSSGTDVAVVHDTLRGRSLGPVPANSGAAITAEGSFYATASPTRHLRVVDTVTGARTSPFLSRPSGEETWASLSDDVSRVAYVSDGHDLLRGTRRGVANVYVWLRAG